MVFETAVLGYVGAEERERVYAILDEAAADGPLAFVQAGEPRPGVHRYYGLWLRLWPAKRELVAHAGFHGSWLEWLA